MPDHFRQHETRVASDHGPVELRILFSIDHYNAVKAVASVPAVLDADGVEVEPAVKAVPGSAAHDDPQYNVHVRADVLDQDGEVLWPIVGEVTSDLPEDKAAEARSLVDWATAQVRSSYEPVS